MSWFNYDGYENELEVVQVFTRETLYHEDGPNVGVYINLFEKDPPEKHGIEISFGGGIRLLIRAEVPEHEEIDYRIALCEWLTPWERP